MLANCLSSVGIQSVRLTPTVEELGLVWSRTQWVKAVAKGWFQMLFGRLGLVWRRTQWVKAVAKGLFQMLFGRLVSGGKCWQIVFFYRIQSARLTLTVQGIGARLEQNSMG